MRLPVLSAVVVATALSSCQNSKELALENLEAGKNAKKEASADNGSETVAPTELDSIATKTISGKVGSVQNLFANYRIPIKGTRFTWRSNWASMPPLVTYESQGAVKLGKAEYVRFKSVEGLAETTFAYYDTENFSLKGYRDANNKALTTFKPVEQRYQFPLEKGKQWISKWKMLDHKTGKVTSGGGVFKVMAVELLKLPAGNFQTARIKLPAPAGLPKGMPHYVWFAPKLGVTVKEQIGNGQMNWTQVLEKVEFPADG